jgi:hypothetical protein
MADFQDQLLAEVKRVRTQPRAYADWLAARRSAYQNDNTLALPAQPLLQTQEGVSALDEAVRVFRAVSEPRPRRAALSRLGLGRRPPEVTAPVSRRNNGRLDVPAVAAESRPASPPGLRTNRRVQLGQ